MRILRCLLLLGLPLSAQDPYNQQSSERRTPEFHVQHLKLELSIDVQARAITGTAAYRLAPLSDGLREVVLDAARLDVQSVTVDGGTATFYSSAEKLYLDLGRPRAKGTVVELAIHYRAKPQRGFFFILPDRNHPNRPAQIWAQGDTAGGNNHFWFPCYDFPNDKFSAEMLVTVPADWEAISNGTLVEVAQQSAVSARTFHWRQDQPVSSYLVSLVAGEFEKQQENWDVPVTYYVPRGHGSEVARTFGRTTRMLDFFSSKIGPYPWTKYAQAAADGFNGGMENPSATTVTTNILLGPYPLEDDRIGTDAAIAHEMAHQWFGDLVTCADWSHVWLHEGFASYFANLWQERAEGHDFFDWLEARAGLDIAARKTADTVVPRDGAGYSQTDDKGAWVLHMVRGQLGDAKFWQAIQQFVSEFRFRTATTADFQHSILQATGLDLAWIFDQFVYRADNPRLEAAWEYPEPLRRVKVTVKQVLESGAAPFHFPVEFEVLGDFPTQTYRATLNAQSQEFLFVVPGEPRTVLFDPRDILLKSITFSKPAQERIWQLQHAPRALNRYEAALALDSFHTPEVAAALTRAIVSDAFFATRLAAAESLARAAGAGSRDPILKLLGDPDPRMRRVAANLLGGQAMDQALVARLLDASRNDSAYPVRQAALASLVQLKPEGLAGMLQPFIEMETSGEPTKPLAIATLARISGDSFVPRLLSLSRATDDRVRRTALKGFITAGRNQKVVLDRLLEALNDDDKVDRLTAIFVLGLRKEVAAIEPLRQIVATDALPGVVRTAKYALEAITARK
jgi:aminopeptidase N